MSQSSDIEERLRQMEQELNSPQQPPMKSADPAQTQFNQASETVVGTAKLGAAGLVSWINGLTGVVKIGAIAVVGILTFSVVKFVVSLAAAAISLVFMVGIIYVSYKLFFEPKPPSQV
jgi:hypothetical protein